MVLPDGLGVVLTSIQLRRSPHGEADEVLQQEHYGSNDAEIAVHRVEMRIVALLLVVLNDGNASDEGEERQKVQQAVDTLPEALLIACMGGLEEQNRLYQHQHGEGLGKRVSRKEDERLGEDASPEKHDEEPDAYLRDDASALFASC